MHHFADGLHQSIPDMPSVHIHIYIYVYTYMHSKYGWLRTPTMVTMSLGHSKAASDSSYAAVKLASASSPALT